jgi:putative redox protein
MEHEEHASTGRSESGSATARIGAACYRTDIEMPEGHALIADEPTFAGGANDGPSPIDLLLASFAACKAVTLRMQADRHGWPMTSAKVTAEHRRASAQELGETGRGVIDLIDCDIEIEGADLNDRQRRRLVDLSNHCWVQHALRHKTRIRTRLVP